MSPKCSLLCKSSRLIFLLVVLVADCLTGRSVVSGNDNSLTFVDANAGKVFAQAGPGHFIAIDTETGSVLWNFQDENLRLFTKPVFRSDALFVAATRTDSKSELIRLDLVTGKTNWRMPFMGLGGNASPVLCGTEVLVSDYWHRTISAFNVLTGNNDWKTESLPYFFLFPPAVLGNDALFVVADKQDPESKQQLMFVSCANGQPGKTLPARIAGVSRTPVLLYKDSAVISGYDRVRGTSLQAIRLSDGAKLWSALIPDEIARFTPTIQNNLLVAGAGSLWIIDLDTGKTVFHGVLPTPSVPVAVANGLVFLSRGSQTVEARELLSGELRWKAKLKGTISSNIVVMNSHAYVKTGEGQMAALKMTGEVDRYFQIGKSRGSASGTLHWCTMH